MFTLKTLELTVIFQGSQFTDSELEIRREHPMIWRTLQEDLSSNRTNDLTTICRNSIQGKVLLADDRGFVCQRSDLLWTGCCNIETEATKLHTCETCNEANCCAIYEYCVSCCLHPNKRPLLEKVLSKASGRQSAVFASVKDHFELCLVKCRTNSHSVQHENKYRDPRLKHCYGETEEHESQKEVAGGGPNVPGNGGGAGRNSIRK